MRNLLSIFSSKHRDPFAAVILFALIVVGVETILGLLPDPKWRGAFVRTLSLPPRSPDVQVMGDSVALEGVVLPTLSTELPGHPFVWTLAKSATGPEFTYFMLQRELAAGLAPKAIVYAPAPHTFGTDRIPLLVGGFCTWPEIWEVARSGKAPMDVLYGIFCKLSFTLRNREPLGEMLRGKKAGQTLNAVSMKEVSAGLRPEMHFVAEQIPAVFKNDFSVKPFPKTFFEKFLTLAQERHIPVYWLTPPIVPAIGETRQACHFDQHLIPFLEDIHQRDGVQILQAESMVYQDYLFKDFMHLNQEGADKFTKFMADKLAPALPQTSGTIKAP